MIPEQALIAFALSDAHTPLPPAATEAAKLILLDTLAVALAARLAGHDAADRALAALDGGGSASVWGRTEGASPAAAALANGTAAETLDHQEVLLEGRNNGHAAVVFVPALLALADHAGAVVTGSDLLAATAVTLAVNRSLLLALGRGHRDAGRGMRTTALGAPIAAALAGARLLRLPPDAATAALGLAAGALPAGLLASLAPDNQSYAMDKELAVGLAARHAVESVLMAAAGVTATATAVTGPRGVLATFGHDTAQPLSAPEGFDGLDRYALKRWPTNYGTQSAIAAALDVRERLDGRSVDAVTVRVKTSSAESLATRKLPSHSAARFSLPYVVASVLLRGAPEPAHFTPAAVTDPAVQELMERTTLEADAAMETRHRAEGVFPAHLSVTPQTGAVMHAEVVDPWLECDPAARREMAEGKARLALSSADPLADDLIAAIGGLDRAGDLGRLTQILRRPLA